MLDSYRQEVTGDMLREIMNSPAVALDTETTGLGFDDRIVGISVAWYSAEGMRSVYLNMGHLPSLFFAQHSQADALDITDACLRSRRLYMHNAVFDLEKLFRWGYMYEWPEPERLRDTQAMSRICLPFAKGEKTSLESLCDRLVEGGFPDAGRAMKGARGKLGSMPAEAVDEYARIDAEMTLRLGDELDGRFVREYGHNSGLDDRESRFVMLLTRMQLAGLRLNQQLVGSKLAQLRDKRSLAAAYLLREHRIVNPGSTRQIVGAMGGPSKFPKTDKGNPRTDAETLSSLGGPVAKAVLEWRGCDKAINTWLEGYRNQVAEDGRLHPRFNAAGTRSGRLSCSNPNLQAVPLEDRGYEFGGMAGLFAPEEGNRLFAFDYSQAELRLASAYAGDNKMAAIFARGQDIHMETARELWPGRKIGRADRQYGKMTNFTMTYGGGAQALAEAAGIEYDDALDIIKRHRGAFPDLSRANREATEVWEKRRVVELWTGRKRWLGEGEPPYAAFNQIIQGGVAEIIKDAMLRVDDYFIQDGLSARLLLQIHDSMEVEISEGDAQKEVLEYVSYLMSNAAPSKIMERTQPPMTMPVDMEEW